MGGLGVAERSRDGAGLEVVAHIRGRGDVRFEPCHHHQTVGPMAGMTTYSMPVLVVENRAAGNRAYSILNEGLGRVLRYGGLGPDVLDRLDWMRRILGPALAAAVRAMPARNRCRKTTMLPASARENPRRNRSHVRATCARAAHRSRIQRL